MKKCQNCKYYDRKRSSENWIVCPVIPLKVIMSGTSENCEKYEKLEIKIVEKGT